MVTRDTPWPAGTPCWIDLAVDDIGKASEFYGRLFGWEFQPGPPEGGYVTCLKNGRAVAGIGPMPQAQGTSAVWMTYLASDNADETVAKVKAAGGQVLVEPVDVMDQVRVAVATDPGGAVFGIWQARKNIGIGLANEPGSLAWSENWSSDFERTIAFYQSVFGYDFSYMDLDGSRYAFISLNGRPVGGIGEVRGGFPARWSIEFAVENPYETVENAIRLAGSVERLPQDAAYGSTVTLRDDQGAIFRVTTMSIGVCPHGNPTFYADGRCMRHPPCP
jgi:predicted enzyme related to lactoylglutathione lyase